MRRSHASLATRLTLWYTSAAFLLVAVAGLIQYRSLRASLAKEDDRELIERLNAVVRASADERRAQADAPRGPMVVRLFGADCRPASVALEAYPPPQCDQRQAGQLSLRGWRSADGPSWRIASTYIAKPSPAWIEVILNRSTDDEVLRAYREELVLVLASALLVAIALGHVIARRGLRPLTQLAGRVSEISVGSLDRRLASDAPQQPQPAEIDALIVSFDAMLERLERAFRALSEFASDLAHELRTPIHIVQQQAEVALQRARAPEEYREVLGSALEELDRMRRMVDDILFLARAEDPRSGIERIPLNIADEVAAVIAFLSATASEYELILTSSVPPALGLSADRMLMRRALVNVLSNAIRHTPPGGRIEVAACRNRTTTTVELRDTGEGIPPELLPRVFDRHIRGRTSGRHRPTGAGLGLAIVRSIMARHGGTVSAANEPEGGARVTLVFPDPPIDTE